MLARLQRALLFVLVCLLPVQSMAAAFAPHVCPPQETSQASTLAHGGEAHAGHTHVHVATQPGDAGADHSGDELSHLCCQQLSSGAPPVPFLPASNEFRVYTAGLSLPLPLHIPELPQRPPRA